MSTVSPKFANVDKTFIGLVVIPFVGSTGQGLKIVLGVRNIGVQSAVNIVITGVLQIGLLAAPLPVLVGWMFEQIMALQMDTKYPTDISTRYAIIAIAFLIHPDTDQ